jgi:hypothetical protein
MLSFGEPPPAAPPAPSGVGAPPPEAPPLAPPVLGEGMPTEGNPPGIGTPTVIDGPDEPPPCPPA